MIREEVDRNGNQVIVFALPWTKVKPDGKDMCCSRQEGPTNPIAAMITHLRINDLPPHATLFSWHHIDGIQVLTHSTFTQCLSEAASQAGLSKVHFHGLCIGSVLEYML